MFCQVSRISILASYTQLLTAERVSDPRVLEAFLPEEAGIAGAARSAIRPGVVERGSRCEIQTEGRGASDDVGLPQPQQRRMNPEGAALNAGARAEVGRA